MLLERFIHISKSISSVYSIIKQLIVNNQQECNDVEMICCYNNRLTKYPLERVRKVWLVINTEYKGGSVCVYNHSILTPYYNISIFKSKPGYGKLQNVTGRMKVRPYVKSVLFVSIGMAPSEFIVNKENPWCV